MAMASPVFQAMFYGSLAETKDYISIVDVESEIFKTMLRYIYTGNIKLSSFNEAMQLYYTANKYMLHDLLTECAIYLQNNVNLENVCQLYEHSQLYEDEVLTQKCISIFTENTKEVLQDSSFKDAALSTVEKIFSMNELNIDSELDLINAAALYESAHDDKVPEKSSSPGIYMAPLEKVANVENNVKDLIEIQNATDGPEQATPGSSDTMNDTENKQQIRSVVRHIRWLTLTPQQYADCSARSLLLTPMEELAVILNIAASRKPNVPMPSGLSTSRVRRDKVDIARSEATFRYTLQDFSSLKRKESPVFYVRNLPWQIEVTSEDLLDVKFLWLQVVCNTESKSTNWSCVANVEIRLICHNPGTENLEQKFQHFYNSEENGCGSPTFLPWDTVLDPTQGYIQDDAITIEVHVAAEEPQGDI